MTSLTTPVVRLEGATRTYQTTAGDFAGIADATFDAAAGEFLAIVGKSGSGKSTLLNLITGVDRATAGRVTVAGRDLGEMSENALARHRGATVGVVLQVPHLIPTLSVLDNVVLPMDLVGVVDREERTARAAGLLESVGLLGQVDKSPGALSAGQQQRVAIARALANRPQVIAADEPTGSLDSGTAQQMYGLLREATASGTAVVMVTHDDDAASLADRVIRVVDGSIVDGVAAAVHR
jgi:putative ABC transport system ATP-binding protein